MENCLVLSSPAPMPLNLHNSCDTQEGVFKVLWSGAGGAGYPPWAGQPTLEKVES